MAWLGRDPEMRLDPRRVTPEAKSVVVVADRYAARGEGDDEPLAAGHGRVARYARGRDYHTHMKKRLHRVCDWVREREPGATCRAFVDTAPIMERELAARAGLGWIGKHTLLIHPKQGSYFLLGGILTSLELSEAAEVVEDHCGTCTRCIEACPTDAITAYSVDATKCIAYLTIEQREAIDPAFYEAIGSWLFGCDICQEVCPHNSPRPTGARDGDEPAHEVYRSGRSSFDLLEVLGWGEDERREALRGSAMKRATLDMFRRNAVIALGNQLRDGEMAEARERLAAVTGDDAEAEMVRDAAREVLARDASARSRGQRGGDGC